MAGKQKTKMYLYLLTIICIAITIAFFWGPREVFNDEIRFQDTSLNNDLDSYLEKKERNIEGILPTAKKEIIWAYPTSKAKTPLAFVYIHGFSASKGETRPVPDNVAKTLKANLYFTRLKGHGAGSEAMATTSAQDWLDDTAEAVEIGTRIGEKVVVIGVSTGATLATIAAAHPRLKNKIDALVLISPNFKVKAAGSQLLTLPYARQWVPFLIGKERSFEPLNDTHATLWTSKYPTTAILPMSALVSHANTLNYETLNKPALFIFSQNDTVVDHNVSHQIMKKWGGETTFHQIVNADDPYNHVIAGDALSPNKTVEVTDAIINWIQNTL